jgi:protein O-mannosyl-transferase
VDRPPPTAPHQRTEPWLALGLVLAVLALYWPVRTHGFVNYDDEVYLTDNPHVARGLDWGELGWLFTHEHAANYHPLTWLSHMLDVELFGLEPGPHHLVNVALHALNAVLVLYLARALLGSAWAAGLAAALFALHPLRVESVAWASERKDVLCASFYLGALLAYLRYGRAPSAGRYALVLGLALLALLAKPMAVTLPCALLLLDLWPLERLERARPWRPESGAGRVWLEKLPLFALVAAASFVTWKAQVVAGAASGTTTVPLDLRAWNALTTVGVYLRQSVWPAELCVFYPLTAVVDDAARTALRTPALLALGGLAASGFLAWRLRLRAPWVLTGLAWFVGLLVPVIGLKQVGSQAHADRYTYLPLVGVAWIVAGGAAALARRGRTERAAVVALALAALAALTVAARRQLATWRDTRTLFERALAVDPRNYVAHASLAADALAAGEVELARTHAAEALAIYPLDPASLTTLGRVELAAGNLDAAQAVLERAARLQATKWVRYHLGKVYQARGDASGAAREYAAALALDPSLVDAHFNLGQARYALGDKAEARACFERALALGPDHAGAWNGLGVLALEAGDLATAEAHFARACELDPGYADALHNLSVVLERLGRTEEARAKAREARDVRAH